MNPDSGLNDRLGLLKHILRPAPAVRLADDRLELFAMLEYMSFAGSIKDKPALWILRAAIQRGEIGPDTTIIESSSGNFACALACCSRLLELKFIPVVDPNVSPVHESFLRAHCRRVVKVPEADGTQGYLTSRLSTVRDLLAQTPNSYWTNQYENRDAMEAHYRLTGSDVIEAVPSLDYVFIGVSSGGTIAGVSRRLKEHNPDLKVIAVDAQGSAIFGQPTAKRWITGLGSSIAPPLLKHALIDDVVSVAEPDAVVGCRELLERHGLFVGGSTGSVYSAIRHYFDEHPPQGKPRVLFFCCDRGTAYLHNVYDTAWAEWRASVERNEPSAEEKLRHRRRAPGSKGLSVVTGPTSRRLLADQPQECLRVVKEAYLAHSAGRSVNPHSTLMTFTRPANARIIALPAHLEEPAPVSGIKWIASYPDNIRSGAPRASAVIVLNSAQNGRPFACLEAAHISATRTAASAALAAGYLVPDGRRVRCLGIVGAGLISRHIYRFLIDTGWSIEQVQIFDIDERAAKRFAKLACDSDAHESIHVSSELDATIRSSDLIVFATVAPQPHVHDASLFSHFPVVLHISLRDLAPEIIAQAQNVVDDPSHVMRAKTSLELAEKLVGAQSLHMATLAEVIEGKRTIPRDAPTIFSPFGLGVLDLAVANWVYHHALREGSLIPIADFFTE